ncbi:RNA-guided endonuclease InsQ/TnpB family protein [Cylindrospermum stagnale]|uniref:RNA-guided endonuclease InsQ/TnpB family protein n=1 Tax=Cylindrospermum stagnale TaxID=142864 RepID=UPI001FE173CD|nr:transposase [Cylindrospermum stagnale]
MRSALRVRSSAECKASRQGYAIADMGFYEFRRQLEYKTQLYGSKLVVVDRFYPSSKTCSSCGEKKISLSLSQRVFQCEHCGFECDRDLNAAINLSSYAARLVGESLWTLLCRHFQVETGRKSRQLLAIVSIFGSESD